MTDHVASNPAVPRLTSLSHGGGCGCKIAPGVLADLLKRSVPLPAFPDLLVGTETADEWTGFLDGAVRSGQRAAAEVAQRL